MNALAQELITHLARHGEVRATDVACSDQAFQSAAALVHEAGLKTLAPDSTTLFAAEAFELLDAARIRAELSAEANQRLTALEVSVVATSTNADALAATPPPVGDFCARLAEYQTAGQGRRGARWQSPMATGLCLSVATRMDATRNVSTLPLACGVAVRRALATMGLAQVQLKWPNDLILDERKLGGLLMQMRQIPGEPSLLVMGLGLNILAIPQNVDAGAMAPVSMREQLLAKVPTRNEVAACLLNALWCASTVYAESGFASFIDDWHSADFLRGRDVRVTDDAGARDGTALGVNENGELQVRMGTAVVDINAGDVSVRRRS